MNKETEFLIIRNAWDILKRIPRRLSGMPILWSLKPTTRRKRRAISKTPTTNFPFASAVARRSAWPISRNGSSRRFSAENQTSSHQPEPRRERREARCGNHQRRRSERAQRSLSRICLQGSELQSGLGGIDDRPCSGNLGLFANTRERNPPCNRVGCFAFRSLRHGFPEGFFVAHLSGRRRVAHSLALQSR